MLLQSPQGDSHIQHFIIAALNSVQICLSVQNQTSLIDLGLVILSDIVKQDPHRCENAVIMLQGPGG